jgi:hypothetical protein
VAGELVSLSGIAPKQHDFTWQIWSFDIEIRHAHILAVCRVPKGWRITAENYAETGLYKEGGAHIKGEATVGHDAFYYNTADRLRRLFLIEPDAKDGPLEFEGSIHIEGVLEAEDESGDHPLKRSSFVLEDRRHCP